MKKILSFIAITLLASCATLNREYYSVKEVSDYNDRVTFLCDSLGIQYPTDENWNTLYTVEDTTINYAKYFWCEKDKNYYRITVYDSDSIDTVILQINNK